MRTGRRLKRFVGAGYSGGDLGDLFFLSNRTLLSVGGVSRAEFWNPRTGRRAQRGFEGVGGDLRAISPDRRLLVSARNGEPSGIDVTELRTGRLLRTLPVRHNDYADVKGASLAFTRDGAHLVHSDHLGYDTNAARVWDTATGRLVQTLGPFRPGSIPVEQKITLADAPDPFVPEGRVAASTPIGITVWNRATGGQVLSRREGWYLLSPDGKTLVGEDLTLFDIATNSPRGELDDPRFLLGGAAFSPDSAWLAAPVYAPGNPQTEEVLSGIRVYAVRTGRFERVLSAPRGELLGSRFGFSRDGRTLVATNRAGDAVFLWDRATGQLRRSVRAPAVPAARSSLAGAGPARRIDAFTLSDDGNLLALAGHERLTFCDAGTGQPRRVVMGVEASALALAFSPDSARLATLGVDGAVRLWDGATGRLVITLRTLPGAKPSAVSADWLSMTPNHYYDCAPGTDGRFLRWRAARDSRLHGANKYAATYHRPERVQAALRAAARLP